MTSSFKNTKSQNDVITTVSHFLSSFEDCVKNEMPNVGVVYDPDFSYESGLSRFIEKSNYNKTEVDPKSDLFIYNRTITEDSQLGIASRARNTIATLRVGSDILKYSCAYSEYDLNFMYVSHSIEMLEKFETVYNSNSGISAIKEVTVNMQDLGDFKYFINALPLTDVTITGEGGVTYKGIIGIMRVRGFFYVFEGKSAVIEEINARLWKTKGDSEGDEDFLLKDFLIE